MEPISAALGIASAIPALIATCKQCVDMLQTMRHADEDCQLISFELVNLQALLGELRDRAASTDQKLESAPAPDLRTPLGRMQSRLDDLKAKIMKRKGHRLRYYFQKQSIEELLQAFDRDKLFLTLEIQKDHEALSKAISTDVRDIRQFLISLSGKVDQIAEAFAEEERAKVLEWLSPQHEIEFATVSSAQESIMDQNSPGDWFLNCTAFETWKSGQNKILYCSGKPGAGKTVLSVIAMDHLEKQIPAVPVASFFCSRKKQTEITYADVLRNLLRQLLAQEERLPDEVQQLWEHRNQRTSHASLDVVIKCLGALLQGDEKRFLVIDALDEFSEEEATRNLLLSKLLELTMAGKTQIMLTSRYKPETVELLAEEHPMCIGIEANVSDVRSYLETRLRNARTAIRKMKEDIIDGIVKKFDGIFLVADLLLKQVLEKKELTLQDLSSLLEEAPPNIGSYYDEALKQINDERVHQMLAWLCLCKRDLVPSEILDALRTQRRNDAVAGHSSEILDIDDLIAASEGLVVQERVSKIVRFRHESVREHISKTLGRASQINIARTLIEYLSFPEFTQRLQQKKPEEAVLAIEKRYPLLQYAARYWGHHADASNEINGALRTEVLRFLKQPFRVSDMYCPHWANQISVQKSLQFWKGSDYEQEADSLHEHVGVKLGSNLPAAHLAVFFGSMDMLVLLVQDGDKLDARTGPGGTPLLWAARLDRLDQARFLLEHDNGACVNVAGINGMAPIHEAVKSASLDMVKLLIRYHANIHQTTADKDGMETPLFKACFHDREDVVDLLWQQGAGSDVDEGRKDDRESTPLTCVLDAGRPKCRDLLLFKHKAFTPSNMTGIPVPLEDRRIFQRLLDEDIDPNQSFGLGQSSLDVALRLGDHDLIQRAIELGAKPHLFWRADNPTITALVPLKDERWMSKLHELLSAQPKPMLTQSIPNPTSTDSRTELLAFEIPKHKPRPRRIIFTITSHDQGWSSLPETQGAYRGSKTWFVARLFEPAKDGSLAPIHYPRLVVWNVHADTSWKTHAVVWDVRDQKKPYDKWMRGLRPGNVLKLIARAGGRGAAWVNHVKQAKVELFEE